MARYVWNNGHGGKDPGKVAKTGQTEAKTNFNVTEFAVPAQKSKGHQVIVTNPKMEYMTPGARARMANDFKANAYISVHHNAGGGTYGLILYDMNDPKSKKLAEYIQREIQKHFPKRIVKIGFKESVKYPGHNFFSDLEIPTCPAVIVEYAFMDSSDLSLINTFDGQRKEAEILVSAVDKFTKEILKI